MSPLYVCSRCKTIDNTACGGNYWFIDDKKKALCAECNPKYGKWHGRFPKEKFDPKLWKKEKGTGFIKRR